jgi:propionate CoA-transferase
MKMLRLPLAERFAYDREQDSFFADFEGMTVRHEAGVLAIRHALEEKPTPLGRKVQAMVDYDNFVVAPGEALLQRGVAPHIFESSKDARTQLRMMDR